MTNQSTRGTYFERRDAARAERMELARDNTEWPYEVKAVGGKVHAMTPDHGGWVLETIGM